jgi:pimeloyl-ACP methyl ester carboxylesterase
LYEPSPTSVYNLFHWAQASRTGRFEAYDYGRHENIVVYDQETPPEFNIADINIPIALLYGDRDYLSTTDDVQFLLTGLPNVVYQEKVIGFRHNDFVWGKNACKTVYKTVIELLAKYNPTTADVTKVEEQIENMPGEKSDTVVEKDQLGIE